MAFHDDVDDANDANDETSSQREFELPLPKPATAKNSGSDSANETTDEGRVDLSEASADGAFNLDADLGTDAPEPKSARDDSAARPGGASSFAPFDLNEEFQRSDIADALDQGMPPWAMAPAPDPTQAVPQLDAPEAADVPDAASVPGASASDSAPVSAASASAAGDDDEDPYRIPADYTTPDFFASRISRRRTPEEAEAENAAAAAAELAALDDEAAVAVEPSITPADADDAFDLSAADAGEDAEEFSFESLFATDEPVSVEPKSPASADDFDDAMWADVSPQSPSDHASPVSPESDAPANHIWKLGPLEPEVAGAPAEPAPAAPVELPANPDTSLPVDEVVEGAPMWNLDGKDAPDVAVAPILGLNGFLSLDTVDEPQSAVPNDSSDDAAFEDSAEVSDDTSPEAEEPASVPAPAPAPADDGAADATPVESVSAFNLDAAFQEAAAAVPTPEADDVFAVPSHDAAVDASGETSAEVAEPESSVESPQDATEAEPDVEIPEIIDASENTSDFDTEIRDDAAEEVTPVSGDESAAAPPIDPVVKFFAAPTAASSTPASDDEFESSGIDVVADVPQISVDEAIDSREGVDIAEVVGDDQASESDATREYADEHLASQDTPFDAVTPDAVTPDAAPTADVTPPPPPAAPWARAADDAADIADAAKPAATESELTEPEVTELGAVDDNEFVAPFAPRQSFVAPTLDEPAPSSEDIFGSAEDAPSVEPEPTVAPAESSFAPKLPVEGVVPERPADAEVTSVESALSSERATGEGDFSSRDATTDADVAESADSSPATDADSANDLPSPPTRRSMADEDLLTWADNPANQSTGTLSVIEVLEAQLRLREEEAREYREWETTFRSRGGPVADQVAEQAQAEIPDVVDAAEVDEAPAHVEPAVSEAAPQSPLAAREAPAAQLPAWDVPPPSESWSPPADFEDEIPFAAHADPTGAITLPASDDAQVVESSTVASDTIEPLVSPAPTQFSAAVAPEAAAPEFAATDEDESAADEQDAAEPTADEQTPAAPLFDPASGLLSFGSAVEAPTADPVVAPVAPEAAHAPAPTVDDNTSASAASDVQPAPEFPADEEGDYDELPFAPPALVEPDIAPSVPRANLDEHVSFGDFGFAPPPADGSVAEASAVAAAEESADAPFAFDLSAESSTPAQHTGTVSDAASAVTAPESAVQFATEADAETDAAPAAAASAQVPDSAPEAAAPAFNFASAENPHYVASEPIDFDELLKTDGIADADVDGAEPEADPLQALLADAAPPLHGDPLSEVQTGSIAVNQVTFEAELDDAVDDSDRLTYPTELSAAVEDASASGSDLDDNEIPFAAGVAGAAVVSGAAAALASQPAPIVAPVPLPAPTAAPAAPEAAAQSVPQPIAHSTAVVAQQPLGLDEVAPTAQKVFSLEESGLEPTPVDRRIGHAARLFWLWFAANSSIVSLGLGAAVFAVGMSLRQSIVAILAGVALSFIPLGLTTLAGKRSGQPTMVVSRASFGVLGNIAPSVVALIARLFWGAVLLWVLASSVAIVLVGSNLNGGLGDRQLLLISLALSFLIALVIAFAGYPLFARIQLILSIISGVLVVGLIGFTAQFIDVPQALTTPDGSWLLTVTGAVLVFSFLGLVWAYSGADIARYQRPSSSGGASMLSATFGAALPAFALIAYGALLAASDPAIARGFLASPLDTLTLLLPSWYPIPLLLAATLSLLSGITLSLYSGGFALQAIGVRVPRQWSIVIVAVLLGALSILFAFGVNGGINELFRDVATTLAVPTAAWAGIFASETMIRTRKLDSAALLSRGGVYGDVRWVNLSAFVVISAIGFALTSATISWLSWQGYGFTALGVDLTSELAGTDLGVLVALGLGLLTPLAAGIPAIRRQEAEQAERAPRPA